MSAAAATSLADFALGLRLAQVPVSMRERTGLLLADMAAVCVAGRAAPASTIAADYAAAAHPGHDACALLDGRRLSAVGAAFANGVLANVLDFDDGHRITKGHPGAVVIPAALATAQLADATPSELLAAVIVGYEVAIRAGVALHRRDPAYHASGAWGGLGAAAAAARLLGLDRERLGHALGLAEYRAPIAPIMRSCAQPAMTKDACAWGASIGVSSALLARAGFTSVEPELHEAPELEDLGTRWRIGEVYLKPYPCCRWTQGAIAAALRAAAGRRLREEEVASVRVRTFAAAAGLARVVPQNTEEAQYNLVWPVAVALTRGGFDERDVLERLRDPAAARLSQRVEVIVEEGLTAAFPQRRLTAVEVRLSDGSLLSAGPLEAAGEPEDPGWAHLARSKFERLVDRRRDLRSPAASGSALATLDAAGLLALMGEAATRPAGEAVLA